MQSVFDQTFFDYEYIIIDGDSTDGSKEEIRKYENKLAYWVSEKDKGIYSAMNKGIAKAEGQFIIFLNSGDYYVSNSLFDYLMPKIVASKADIFFCPFIWDDPINKNIILSDHSGIFYHWDLKERNFPHPGTLYNRKAFSTVGLFNEEYKILGDFDWNARALISYNLSFHYENIITAYFVANGISTNKKHSDLRKKEQNLINSLYFNPKWLFKTVENNKNKFYKKLLARFYKKRLNKI
jgi:glycosyltransferase involved in cell wall biosynthesis